MIKDTIQVDGHFSARIESQNFTKSHMTDPVELQIPKQAKTVFRKDTMITSVGYCFTRIQGTKKYTSVRRHLEALATSLQTHTPSYCFSRIIIAWGSDLVGEKNLGTSIAIYLQENLLTRSGGAENSLLDAYGGAP